MTRLIVLSLLLIHVMSSAAFADEATAAAVKKIEESGGTVRPIASNDPRVEVSFHFAGDKFRDEMLAPVAGLGNVFELRLDNTPLSSAGLAQIAELTSLVRLHLEKTKIDDAGLAHLANLENLQYLNLYGTSVTDAGLEKLAGLKNLRKLFVWQTQVTDAGAAKLKAALPELTIDRGWDSPAEPK
jgi:hypothetical protein